ncbi:MAG: hypothetical protein ACXVFK_15675 [Solirubrobacteraceae bacterium]
MSVRCWVALLEARPDGADAAASLTAADGTPAGWLAAWRRASKPVRDARRADPRIVDPSGRGAVVSLVLPPRAALPLFDDPAVQQARRAVLADAEPPDLVTTLLVDDSRFGGALTARRGPDALVRLRDDPFARVWPARLLRAGPGLLGTVARPAGPGIERHGSATPWPGGRYMRNTP